MLCGSFGVSHLVVIKSTVLAPETAAQDQTLDIMKSSKILAA